MRIITTTVALTTVLFLGVVAFLPADSANAQAGKVRDGLTAVTDGETPSFDNSVKTIMDTFLYLVGAVAVVMIVYGGFKYVTSGGESAALTSAKNTIMYAVVGIIIAVSAYAIASFAIGMLDSSSESDSSGTPTRNPRSDLDPDDPMYIGPTP